MEFFWISYMMLWLLVVAEGIAIVVLTRTLGSMLLGTRDAIERDGLEPGTVAPEFEATDPNGQRVALAEMLGKWLVLIFAYPSCRICRSMLPSLAELDSRLGGAAKLIVLLRASSEDAALYASELKSAVPMFAIGQHGVAERYRVRVSPFVHVVDPDGIVRAKGLVNEAHHIEHLLSEAGFEHAVASRHQIRTTAEVRA